MKPEAIARFIRKWWKPLAGVAGFAVMVVYAGGMLHEKTAPDALARTAGRELPAGAEVIRVAKSAVASQIDIIGSTASDRMIQISPRLVAVVDEVAVKAGDRVAAGQVLVRLDDREIRQQLTAAEAALKQAEAELRRTRQLFEKNASTEQALTAAETAHQSALANVDQIRVMLSYATVTSPIDGIVAESRVEAGDMANPGGVLLSVYDPTDMRLEVPVPVRLIDRFEMGQERIATLDFPSGTYTAVVKEIVGEIDPMSRTRRVKLQLDTRGEDILPGTFGRIWVAGDERRAIVLPAPAVLRIGQLEMVDAVENGRVFRRLIKSAPGSDGAREILSGLKDGDTILATPVEEK